MKLKYGLILVVIVSIVTLTATLNLANSASQPITTAQPSVTAGAPPFLVVGNTYWVYYFDQRMFGAQITVLEIGQDGWIKVQPNEGANFGLKSDGDVWLNTNLIHVIQDTAPPPAATSAPPTWTPAR